MICVQCVLAYLSRPPTPVILTCLGFGSAAPVKVLPFTGFSFGTRPPLEGFACLGAFLVLVPVAATTASCAATEARNAAIAAGSSLAAAAASLAAAAASSAAAFLAPWPDWKSRRQGFAAAACSGTKLVELHGDMLIVSASALGSLPGVHPPAFQHTQRSTQLQTGCLQYRRSHSLFSCARTAFNAQNTVPGPRHEQECARTA